MGTDVITRMNLILRDNEEEEEEEEEEEKYEKIGEAREVGWFNLREGSSNGSSSIHSSIMEGVLESERRMALETGFILNKRTRKHVESGLNNNGSSPKKKKKKMSINS